MQTLLFDIGFIRHDFHALWGTVSPVMGFDIAFYIWLLHRFTIIHPTALCDDLAVIHKPNLPSGWELDIDIGKLLLPVRNNPAWQQRDMLHGFIVDHNTLIVRYTRAT